jgi:hypothetical protein
MISLFFTAAALVAAPIAAAQQHAHLATLSSSSASIAAATKQSHTNTTNNTYSSAFDGYQRFRLDEPLIEWRRSNTGNDDMARLGGHAGHLRASAPPPTDPATPQPSGHAHHGGKP